MVLKALHTTASTATGRSAGRDVHLYDAADPTTSLGGLVLSSGINNTNFYAMVEVFLGFESSYVLRHEDATDPTKDIPRNDQALQAGNYYIITSGSFEVNYEVPLLRTVPVSSNGRFKVTFRNAVRDRDQNCAITQQCAHRAQWGDFRGFVETQIFPLAYEAHWERSNYGRWITIQPVPETAGTINSVQNGILLRGDVHTLFETYAISINPDDNYKIVCFDGDGLGVGGTHLSQELLEDPRRPVDELLRWHFHQAVLTNVKGNGEPIFEPPGSDIMAGILSGTAAAEKMESELFGRLPAH